MNLLEQGPSKSSTSGGGEREHVGDTYHRLRSLPAREGEPEGLDPRVDPMVLDRVDAPVIGRRMAPAPQLLQQSVVLRRVPIAHGERRELGSERAGQFIETVDPHRFRLGRADRP